jgi:hypothetical protein
MMPAKRLATSLLRIPDEPKVGHDVEVALTKTDRRETGDMIQRVLHPMNAGHLAVDGPADARRQVVSVSMTTIVNVIRGLRGQSGLLTLSQGPPRRVLPLDTPIGCPPRNDARLVEGESKGWEPPSTPADVRLIRVLGGTQSPSSKG